MEKKIVEIKTRLSKDSCLSGTDVDLIYDGKVVASLYILPDGTMCIHDADEILILKEHATVGTYSSESLIGLKPTEYHDIIFTYHMDKGKAPREEKEEEKEKEQFKEMMENAPEGF